MAQDDMSYGNEAELTTVMGHGWYISVLLSYPYIARCGDEHEKYSVE